MSIWFPAVRQRCGDYTWPLGANGAGSRVLFLVAIGQRFTVRHVRLALLGMACILLAVALHVMITDTLI